MTISHPPEPWSPLTYEDSRYEDVAFVSIAHSGDGCVVDGIEKIAAERICLCVNALREIPTDDIRKCDSSLMALASMIADRFDMVQTYPT